MTSLIIGERVGSASLACTGKEKDKDRQKNKEANRVYARVCIARSFKAVTLALLV
ncbi:MAG TPA: hypothetical protein VJB70_02675 [Candidatus Paceibacterota bacterium]